MPFKLFAQSLAGAALFASLPLQADTIKWVDTGMSPINGDSAAMSTCKHFCPDSAPHFTGQIQAQQDAYENWHYFCGCETVGTEISQSKLGKKLKL